MSTRLACLALLALLAATSTATSTASAQSLVATDEIERRPTIRRVEGRIGMWLGGSDVGDADGFSIGVTTGIGYRIGDLTLRGRFDHFRVGDGGDEAMERRGRSTRIGGAIRYSFANTAEHDRESGGVGVDFWGEVGLGVEHITWRRGGILDRPSGELAIGVELDGYSKPNTHRRRRHGGYFLAFRSLIGQGPEMEGPAICGGPCTKATKPSRADVSMFFEIGLHWGR